MPAPTDLEMVNAAAAIYVPASAAFDHFIQVSPFAPHVGVAHRNGYDMVAVRGSKTIDDWERDAASEAGHIVRGYEKLGLLPFGFSDHLADTYAAVAKVLRPVPVAFGGHSLGAPESAYLAAAHIMAGGQFSRLAIFEPPNPGTAHLAAVFTGRDAQGWRNEGDAVPDLPFPIHPFLPWQPLVAAHRFNLPPLPSDTGLFGRHNIALCQQFIRSAAGASA